MTKVGPHLLVATLLLVLATARADAATFEIPADNPQALKVAIETANANGEDDIINLAPDTTYVLRNADNSTSAYGANGMPVLTADGGHSVTINGRGATIACFPESNSPWFRVFQIGSGANVTINMLRLIQGRAVASLTSGGGAIVIDQGNLTLVDCVISNNSVASSPNANAPRVAGGAIYNNAGVLALRGCTVQGNSVNQGAMHAGSGTFTGGAIYSVNGTVAAQNCTFASNAIVLAFGGSSSDIVNGGAIASQTSRSDAQARLTISQCTFSGNGTIAPASTPILGTAIYSTGDGAAVSIGSSILSGREAIVSAPSGGVTSAGYNLTNGNDQGFLTAVGDQVGMDAQLRAIAQNGRFTPTCLPALTSPAIDRGKRNAIPELAVTTDQRGVARPYDWRGVISPGGGDRSDVGAVELVPTRTVTTVADNANGACDAAHCTLREAINAANAQPDLDTIGFAPGVTGAINLTSALPQLARDVEIGGPGANALTVRRGNSTAFRIFLVAHFESNRPGPDVWLRGLTLANGQAPGTGSSGGAIFNEGGRLRIAECVLRSNSATVGAAIFNTRGAITLTESAVSGNTASQSGAFYNNGFQGAATIDLLNSTMAGNSAANGAVVYNDASFGFAKVTLLNCTLSGNASSSGGFYSDGSRANVTLRNTILSGASGTANFTLVNGATVTSQGNNLSNDAADGGADTGPGGLLNQPGDMRNTDPRLDPNGLSDNGGPTTTIALLADSPAVNAANSAAAPPFDQRGYGRAGAADIGAFELNGIEPPPAPISNRFANISTRLRVDTGDNVLIGGFIVTGTMQKRIIVRAIGPSVPVDNRLQNPKLELYDGSGNLLAANDNWQDAPNRQEIIDSTIPPPNDLESAILQNVQLGPHTAVVSGVNGGTGVGLVEVYDLGDNQDSRLANISTRGRVLTGDDVMIAGIIATGSSPQKVIIRAIGPSLEVPGRLEDPSLELVDGNGNPITANNNWKESQQAEIEGSGIPPSNDLESAIVTFLAPAPYTALVRGVNDTTGVAVVEVYALQ